MTRLNLSQSEAVEDPSTSTPQTPSETAKDCQKRHYQETAADRFSKISAQIENLQIYSQYFSLCLSFSLDMIAILRNHDACISYINYCENSPNHLLLVKMLPELL